MIFRAYLFCFLGFSAVLGGVFFRERVEFHAVQSAAARRALAQIESQLAPQIVQPSTSRIPPPTSNFSLLFVGDVMLSRGVDYMVKKYGGGDFRYPFLKIADELKRADFLFGNLEGPISDRGSNQGSIYSFRAEPKAVEGLMFAGFDVMSLANNHILDWGRDALVDTVSVLGVNGIKSVGAGRNYDEANKPVFFALGSLRFAFLAYTNLYPKSLEATADRPGISSFDIEKAKERIRAVRPEADIVIVSFHWGDEYQTYSNALQQSIAHAMIDAGADLVVGHHPHVAQEIAAYEVGEPRPQGGREQYRKGYIIYSLGNFVFDQNFSEDTRKGLMAKVTVNADSKKIENMEPIEIRFTKTFQPEVYKIQ